MRGPRRFCQSESNFDNVFFLGLMRGERIQIPLKAGYHRPASETPFKPAAKRHVNGVLLAGQ